MKLAPFDSRKNSQSSPHDPEARPGKRTGLDRTQLAGMLILLGLLLLATAIRYWKIIFP